ncbi:MAG: DUF2877 domain-containing protein [Nitrososphaerota archaeon]
METLEAVAGFEVPQIIKRDGGGHVEAKGRRIIYVRTKGDDIIIIAPSPLTPYTLSLGEGWGELARSVAEDMKIVPTDEGLLVGDMVSISFGDLSWSGRMPRLGFPPPESVRLATVIQAILDLRQYSDNPLVEATYPTSLESLVGLGPGTTPAGDDFVAGYLLGLHAIGNTFEASSIINRAAIVSRWPSWKMIEHASHGCAFFQLANLYRAMVSGLLDDVVKWSVETMRLGGSSGPSLLAGFLKSMARASC